MNERYEACSSFLHLHLHLQEGCFKFSKGVQRPRKLKYEVLRILWRGGGGGEGGGSLGKGDIGEETGQFRGWIERLSSQGEQSLRQIFTRECILSMWVSATLEDVWVIGVLIGVPLPRILSQDRYHLLLCSPTLFGAYCAPRVYFALIDVSGCRECEQNYTTKIPNVWMVERKRFWPFFINVDGKLKLHEEKKRKEFVAGKLHFTNCFVHGISARIGIRTLTKATQNAFGFRSSSSKKGEAKKTRRWRNCPIKSNERWSPSRTLQRRRRHQTIHQDTQGSNHEAFAVRPSWGSTRKFTLRTGIRLLKPDLFR